MLGDEIWSKFPIVDGVRPVVDDPVELILNRTWRPALAVTGADGFPPIINAGNVLRPRTAFKLSLRIRRGWIPRRPPIMSRICSNEIRPTAPACA